MYNSASKNMCCVSWSHLIMRFYGARRIRLTSKHGNKQYYKGNRGGSMGTITPYGRFVSDPGKIRDWVIPDLSGFELRAYVSKETRPVQNAVKNIKSYMEAAMANDADKI